jgi:hypothetical protein
MTTGAIAALSTTKRGVELGSDRADIHDDCSAGSAPTPTVIRCCTRVVLSIGYNANSITFDAWCMENNDASTGNSITTNTIVLMPSTATTTEDKSVEGRVTNCTARHAMHSERKTTAPLVATTSAGSSVAPSTTASIMRISTTTARCP